MSRVQNSPVTELLDVLPDLVALARERGAPIRVPDPGTEHGRDLLLAIGVGIEPNGYFVQVGPHEWEERDLDGRVVQRHSTTKRRRKP